MIELAPSHLVTIAENLALECTAVAEQPSTPFDISSMWKSYADSVDAWKKNYETFLQNAQSGAEVVSEKPEPDRAPEQAEPDSAASLFDGAVRHWQKSGEGLFKSFVQNQVELCEFFRDRWALYLKLPEKLSDCNSLTELKKLQAAFLHEFANDYLQEMKKRAQPLTELARQAASHR